MKKRSGRRSRPPGSYSERTYRQRAVCGGDLISFRIVCQETDLMIQADGMLAHEAREQVLSCRGHIEGYIQRYPNFATTLVPWKEQAFAPGVVRRMIEAGIAADVGPMAAVAGAVAECVGRRLLRYSRQVIVENGGDIFVKTDTPVIAGLFAGASPLSMKMGIRLPAIPAGLGLCTSSATVGHSLSKGRADAVSVVSLSCALADAAATAIGNRVRSSHDIKAAIDAGRRIAGVMGIVVVTGREMGAWGRVELVPLNGKKG
jgi:hypothetical protein